MTKKTEATKKLKQLHKLNQTQPCKDIDLRDAQMKQALKY